MNKEESIYGFLAHTKASRVNGEDRDVLLEYVLANGCNIENTNNLNRIILKTINTNQVEPIKASRRYNAQEQRIEIKVTYTANGISKILDDYGEEMALTEENGIILTDTGNEALRKGEYYFTIIDNKGNKQELSITPNVDSLFKVAYISGIDNMDNTATYTKTRETKTEDEKNLINQLYDKLYETDPDSNITYRKAIKDTNQNITVIESLTRTEEDEQLYVWSVYDVVTETGWVCQSSSSRTVWGGNTMYFYKTLSEGTGRATLSSSANTTVKSSTFNSLPHCVYTLTSDPTARITSTNVNVTSYYSWTKSTGFGDSYWQFSVRYYVLKTQYKRGDFRNYSIAQKNEYENNEVGPENELDYELGSLAPKYTLTKYSSDLNLLSTYDVDTATLTTAPIDISNKGRNKVKLTLNTTGTDYKTYISNDNINWQEVTDITSGTPKELDVDGWNNLYIKIEANTSTINNIDVAYYKD